MSKKHIVIMRITPSGEIELKTVKNAGKTCAATAEKLAKSLGLTVKKGTEGPTADFYKTNTATTVEA